MIGGINGCGSAGGLWLLLFALLCITLPVALVIRPRLAYLFPTTVVLMALVGTAVQILTRSRKTITKFACVGIVLALTVGLPSAYSATSFRSAALLELPTPAAFQAVANTNRQERPPARL